MFADKPASSTLGTNDRLQDATLPSFSRSSEDLSLSDEPPPLPTSPVPTEPVSPFSSDLDDVQVSDWMLEFLHKVGTLLCGWSVRSADTLASFKRKVKTYLFNISF